MDRITLSIETDADPRDVEALGRGLRWHLAILWVAPGFRRRGLGARLLAAIESAALDRGCTRAHLDTFSYQAKPFYERHGYAVFAVLDDYPPGHERIFLRKTLGHETAPPDSGGSGVPSP